jgi:hypothetical protein
VAAVIREPPGRTRSGGRSSRWKSASR